MTDSTKPATTHSQPIGRGRRLVGWLIYVAAAIGINSIYLIAQIQAFGSDENSDLIGFTTVLGMPFAVAVILFGASLPAFLKKSWRRTAGRVLAMAGIWLFCAVAFTTAGMRHRLKAFQALAQNSAGLIHAIQRFETDRGAPPKTLKQLTPKHLSSLPKTGIGSFPEYRYIVFTQSQGAARKTRVAETWLLYAGAPEFVTDWRCLVYCSDGDYDRFPREIYFGRIGDWALLSRGPEEYVASNANERGQ